jgi:hypothetical protein
MNKYKCDICKQMINNSHTTKKHMICGRCMRISKQFAYEVKRLKKWTEEK